MAEVIIESLSVTLGGKPILTPLSHRFAAGKWHVILGKSGVGKSTLLAAIAGLLPENAIAGDILIDGHTNPRGHIALMAQQNDLLPWLNARDNITLGARLRGERAQKQDAEHWLDAIGLGGQGNKRPAQFSGGERQRLAIAALLVQQPRLYLLDEPLAHLDLHHQVAVLDHFRQLAAHGAGVAMVLHDINLAARYASHVLLLDGAGGHAIGPAAQVLTVDRLSAAFGHPLRAVADGDDTLFVPE